MVLTTSYKKAVSTGTRSQKLILSWSFRYDQTLIWIWLHFDVMLKSDLDVQQTQLSS